MGMFTSLGLCNRPRAPDQEKIWSPVSKFVCCLRCSSNPRKSPGGFCSPVYLQSLHFVLSLVACVTATGPSGEAGDPGLGSTSEKGSWCNPKCDGLTWEMFMTGNVLCNPGNLLG